jgi:hypothetical protein
MLASWEERSTPKTNSHVQNDTSCLVCEIDHVVVQVSTTLIMPASPHQLGLAACRHLLSAPPHGRNSAVLNDSDSDAAPTRRCSLLRFRAQPSTRSSITPPRSRVTVQQAPHTPILLSSHVARSTLKNNGTKSSSSRTSLGVQPSILALGIASLLRPPLPVPATAALSKLQRWRQRQRQRAQSPNTPPHAAPAPLLPHPMTQSEIASGRSCPAPVSALFEHQCASPSPSHHAFSTSFHHSNTLPIQQYDPSVLIPTSHPAHIGSSSAASYITSPPDACKPADSDWPITPTIQNLSQRLRFLSSDASTLPALPQFTTPAQNHTHPACHAAQPSLSMNASPEQYHAMALPIELAELNATTQAALTACVDSAAARLEESPSAALQVRPPAA